MTNKYDPIALFEEWFEEAKNDSRIVEPTAFTLATATKDGVPSARIVLLKDFSSEGFVFYTNLTSKKGIELKDNPLASLCFYWEEIGKQVRIDGAVNKVQEKDADAYFATRPRERQLSAWASKQSVMLEDMKVLEERITLIDEDFKGMDIPRPPFWSGYVVSPDVIEFWERGQYRRHKRDLFTRVANGWQHEMLYP